MVAARGMEARAAAAREGLERAAVATAPPGASRAAVARVVAMGVVVRVAAMAEAVKGAVRAAAARAAERAAARAAVVRAVAARAVAASRGSATCRRWAACRKAGRVVSRPRSRPSHAPSPPLRLLLLPLVLPPLVLLLLMLLMQPPLLQHVGFERRGARAGARHSTWRGYSTQR